MLTTRKILWGLNLIAPIILLKSESRFCIIIIILTQSDFEVIEVVVLVEPHACPPQGRSMYLAHHDAKTSIEAKMITLYAFEMF